MTTFWQLKAPIYSDYHHTFINGTVEHPYGLPGIRCDKCGQTWISAARVLPIKCPPSIGQSLPTGPVSIQKYREICESICEISHCAIADLKPGNDFLPSSMAVPSRPQADFFWGSLGSLIVSEKIKDSFTLACVSGILFFPISFSKVGRRDAKLPPPIPDSGEPEDMMQHAVHAQGPRIGKYFEMIVTADSERVKGTEPRSVCRDCGCEKWSPPSRWMMHESLWKGADVFCLAPTSMVVATNRVKERLVEIGATNVRAVPIG